MPTSRCLPGTPASRRRARGCGNRQHAGHPLSGSHHGSAGPVPPPAGHAGVDPRLSWRGTGSRGARRRSPRPARAHLARGAFVSGMDLGLVTGTIVAAGSRWSHFRPVPPPARPPRASSPLTPRSAAGRRHDCFSATKTATRPGGWRRVSQLAPAKAGSSSERNGAPREPLPAIGLEGRWATWPSATSPS
jgi:hypothetical protein